MGWSNAGGWQQNGWGKAPVVSGFTPLSLPSLKAWYKADTGVFNDAGVTPATNGQTVQQWNDQSGNGFTLLQASSSNRPNFLSTGLNGHATLEFGNAGGNDTWLPNAAFTLTGSTSSAFMVASITTGIGTFRRIIQFTDVGSEKPWFLTGGSTTTILGFDGSSTLSGVTVVLDTPAQLGGIWDGTNFTGYKANSPGSSDPSTFSYLTGTLGVGGASGNSAIFNLSELVITNNAMSSGDRISLASYFTTKWGV